MLGAEVATYLATQGFGTVNTSLFYNFVPPDPDTLMAVLEYGGEADEPTLGEGGTLTRYEFLRFQLLVRGIRDDNDTVELRCIQGRAALVAILNTSLSGVRYIGIDALTPPAPLIIDGDFRAYWICNFRAIKAPSTS